VTVERPLWLHGQPRDPERFERSRDVEPTLRHAVLPGALRTVGGDDERAVGLLGRRPGGHTVELVAVVVCDEQDVEVRGQSAVGIGDGCRRRSLSKSRSNATVVPSARSIRLRFPSQQSASPSSAAAASLRRVSGVVRARTRASTTVERGGSTASRRARRGPPGAHQPARGTVGGRWDRRRRRRNRTARAGRLPGATLPPAGEASCPNTPYVA